MTFSSGLLLVATLVAVVAPDAPEQTPEESRETAAEVTYTIPAGWERLEQDRIVVLTPKGMTPQKCALIITPGETLEGDNFLKWFKDKWDALRKDAKVVQGGERTGQDGPNESSVLYQAALLEAAGEGGTKQRTGLLLYAVHIGDAVHWIVFKTNGPALFNQHKKTVNRFLAGLKFAEAKPKDQPRDQPGKPKKPVEPASDRAQASQVLKADPH
jgi:hypothetical protein